VPPTGGTGGQHSIRRTICNGRPARYATAATLSATTFIQRQVAEWNVGCERCHGPGSEHAAKQMPCNILNPAHMDYVAASDTCIQCHSQGQPISNPIEDRYYDWPVGYTVGMKLQDHRKLEESTSVRQPTFCITRTAQRIKTGCRAMISFKASCIPAAITCFDSHDVHGTENHAQLRKPRRPAMFGLRRASFTERSVHRYPRRTHPP
jgi:hypothetical protein